MAELDDIRSFIAVVEAGGFGRAAQTLGLAKSIVSRRVSRLEEELGTRLLSRTTRGVTATEAGLEFRRAASVSWPSWRKRARPWRNARAASPGGCGWRCR